MTADVQKASFWKRMSACLFDIIILAIVAIGAASALSAIFGYDGYSEKMTRYYEQYEEQYGVDFDISVEDFAIIANSFDPYYSVEDGVITGTMNYYVAGVQEA